MPAFPFLLWLLCAAVAPSNRRRTWLTITEAAAHLGVHERTIRRWLAEGRLRGYRSGTVKMIRLDLADLDSLLSPFGGEDA